MYNPTTRLLTVLELLQARGRIGGAELAERLEVDPRSVRRYVTMLQEIGIPVTSERGRYGGYQLRPGFRLPPLMFTEDEALALTLGLLMARQLGVAGAAPAFEGALAKVERVLPVAVREEVRAVQDTLTIDIARRSVPPAPDVVLAFSGAARDRRRLRIRHRGGEGVTTREVDTYGLVHRAGRWYAVGWCHLRTDLRAFRLDRVVEAQPLEERFTRPEGFDAREFLLSSLAGSWSGWTAVVLLDAPIDRARFLISPIEGSLRETPDGVLFTTRTDDLDWLAGLLASLRFRFTVREPPELLDALRRLGERLDECVARSAGA